MTYKLKTDFSKIRKTAWTHLNELFIMNNKISHAWHDI